MRVLITGGTGSLGHGLVQGLLASRPSERITVYSRDEVKQNEMRGLWPNVRFMLGDVRDERRLAIAMRQQDVVIHAAAYKQVPSAEANVDEAIATNVLGSLNVARMAVEAGVSHVVGISTDKACAPVNAYGETKALMEKLFQQADTWSATRFTLVRYGNVLGSRGSVVPLFQKQVSQGKFTLTDPLMTRFWMTLDDAVNLVLTALVDRAIPRGAIVVPACKASTMMTLLEAVVSCCTGKDLQPSQVKVIGARPGEKQHEALIHKAESLHTLAWQGCGHFHVLPATAEYRGEPFEYTSVDAPRLSVGDIIRMLT